MCYLPCTGSAICKGLKDQANLVQFYKEKKKKKDVKENVMHSSYLFPFP